MLYIVRHGKAERDSATNRDEDRVLKARGVGQAQFLGQHFQVGTALGAAAGAGGVASAGGSVRPAVVLASPVVRAADTARIIAQLASLPLRTCEWLSTAGEHRTVMHMLAEEFSQAGVKHAGPIMIVGHNPTLEDLVITLCMSGRGKVNRPELVWPGADGPEGEVPQREFGGMRTGMLAEVHLVRDSSGAVRLASGSGMLVRMLRQDWDAE